jgi:NAD(P)-dependent dehydrogenase (short-subunit alcohol dehydrogenase family)
MNSFAPGGFAVVVGASGGIGAALVAALADESAFPTVLALSRGFSDDRETGQKARCGYIDVTNEDSIAAAARRIASPIRLLIVATGVLHGHKNLQPEKTFRALDGAALLENFRVNTVGPALVAKHFLPLLASRGKTVFAALSARVGSIGDNRAGGWHGYRASKAALNMIIKNLAIEMARKYPEMICVGLHPGTVDTGLSRPFQRGVPTEKLFAPAYSAARLLAVIDGLSVPDSGGVFAWNGTRIPP